MENRRQNHRHTLVLRTRIPVELEVASRRITLAGEVVDLSIRGLSVQIDDRRMPLTAHDFLLVRLQLPGNEQRLEFKCEVAHCHIQAGSLHCGLRFFPTTDPQAEEERDTILWRFLVDGQKQLREEKQQADKPAVPAAKASTSVP